jgi:hypothetical protein
VCVCVCVCFAFTSQVDFSIGKVGSCLK